ncbi:MAG: PD-(D/E)XK nuclease family protein [Candidatus Nitrosopolaris sp.]
MLKYFIGGEIKHLQLQNLLGPDFDCEKEIVYTTPNGVRIIGHCDAVHRATNTVIEFKTTESVKVGHEPYSYNLKQLMMYMAILNSSRGVLLYLIVGSTHKISEYFPEYHLTMTEDERHNMLKRIQKDATELQNGINNKDPNLVGHILGSSIYRNPDGKSWYCSSCPYKKACNGYKEFESEDDLQKMQTPFEHKYPI